MIITVLSHDLENDPDIVAMVAASAALTLSGVPFAGPVGAARVGYVDGGYVLNPPLPEMENTKLDLVVAGTNEAVLMVESEAQELPEDINARRRDVRSQAFPAGDRCDHPSGREGRQGAARFSRRRTFPRSRRPCSRSSKPICAPPTSIATSSSAMLPSTLPRRR